MGGVVGGAEPLRPEAGEGLGLVAAGEEGQLLGGVVADGFEPGDGRCEGLVPGDLLILAGAAGPYALERRAKAGRRVDLHDPRRALGTENALVDGVVPVALDIGDLRFALRVVLEVDVDATAAGAHVASGLRDAVGDGFREVQRGGRVRHG